MGILAAILASVFGGAASAYVGSKTAPKPPQAPPSIGGGAYGAQNPAIMQMLASLTGQQAQGQQANKMNQQQMLQQMLMAMMMQSMPQQQQSSVQIGRPTPIMQPGGMR